MAGIYPKDSEKGRNREADRVVFLANEHMKLSDYAKKVGVGYDTALDWFHKNNIPGAYQMPSGTIIVPDIVGDDTAKVISDLSSPSTFNVSVDENGAEVKRKPKTQTDILREQIAQMQATTNAGLSPADLMNAGAVLPKAAPVRTRDYAAESAARMDKCIAIVDAIASNYVDDDSLRALPKVRVLLEMQAEKLADLELAAETARETLTTIREALDSGGPPERALEVQATYLSQLKDTANNRSRHLDAIETYWLNQASRLGIKDQAERVVQEAEQVAKAEAPEKETMYTQNTRGMNDMIAEKMKQLQESGFGK